MNVDVTALPWWASTRREQIRHGSMMPPSTKMVMPVV